MDIEIIKPTIFKCSCGLTLCYSSKYNHLRSKKHFDAIQNILKKKEFEKMKNELNTLYNYFNKIKIES